MKKTRVLFHVTHLRRGGGIETSLMSWLRILEREHFSVGLSIAYPNGDMATVFREHVPKDVALHILGAEPWLSHCRNLKKEGKLGWLGLVYEEILLPQVRKRIFRQRIERIVQSYDVVIDYDMSLARFATNFLQPLVGVSHFSPAQRLSKSKRKYRTAARFYRHYDAIVSICNAMRNEAQELFPELASRFITLYPGFDFAQVWQRANEVIENVPCGPYIVTVTRLEETQKDVTTLIKAFAMLVKEHRIAETLLIIGEGRHRSQLEALAKELDVYERITFLGFTPNPLPYVRQARMMVLSSKFEGLPTALIEGAIIGQVLVSSDCPTGPREILDAGKAGLLVPVGESKILALAMLEALKNEELRHTLQQSVLNHANNFKKESALQNFSELLQRLREVKQSCAA